MFANTFAKRDRTRREPAMLEGVAVALWRAAFAFRPQNRWGIFRLLVFQRFSLCGCFAIFALFREPPGGSVLKRGDIGFHLQSERIERGHIEAREGADAARLAAQRAHMMDL